MKSAEWVIRRFLDGDEDAFTELVRQWERKVFNLAWRMLGNREDAQDVMQETFLSVFKSLRYLRDPTSFSTWIYRIVLNHCRGRWRSGGRTVPLENRVELDEGETVLSTAGPPSPSHEAAVETADLVRRALAGLSEYHRTAVVLKEYMGLSLEEVAAVMDCPLSTAKSRVYHGLRGLQKSLVRLGVAGR
jgi:RNA polymerase sigma-70 factor (ECF subfamily)